MKTIANILIHPMAFRFEDSFSERAVYPGRALALVAAAVAVATLLGSAV